MKPFSFYGTRKEFVMCANRYYMEKQKREEPCLKDFEIISPDELTKEEIEQLKKEFHEPLPPDDQEK